MMPASVVSNYYYFNYKASHLTKALESCSDSCRADDRRQRNARCFGRILRRKRYPELPELAKGPVRTAGGRAGTPPVLVLLISGLNEIMIYQFLQLFLIALNDFTLFLQF